MNAPIERKMRVLKKEYVRLNPLKLKLERAFWFLSVASRFILDKENIDQIDEKFCNPTYYYYFNNHKVNT